jgi:hypothetical protein
MRISKEEREILANFLSVLVSYMREDPKASKAILAQVADWEIDLRVAKDED